MSLRISNKSFSSLLVLSASESDFVNKTKSEVGFYWVIYRSDLNRRRC